MDLLKVNSNNETLLEDFFYFMKNHKPHGHKDWPEIKEEFCSSLTNELYEKKSFLYLLKEPKTILNYFYIKFEKSINRIILLSYNPEDLIEYSKYLIELKNKKNYSIEIGLRDSEISKFIKNNTYFKIFKRYNLMNLKKMDYVETNPVNSQHNLILKNIENSEDIKSLVKIQNECFNDHHGYEINTYESIKNELNLKSTSYKNVHVICNEEKNWMAYAWMFVYKEKSTGKLSMCGVRKQFRSLGLAQKIINVGIQNLFDQGLNKIILEVDNENYAAKKIYSTMGFKTYDNINWYKFNSKSI
tara:strand:- start:268 stop:1170 length:903 start_codon:yes stop_codon:yes gene_type:complete